VTGQIQSGNQLIDKSRFVVNHPDTRGHCVVFSFNHAARAGTVAYLLARKQTGLSLSPFPGLTVRFHTKLANFHGPSKRSNRRFTTP
jgi:hypothetical protein